MRLALTITFFLFLNLLLVVTPKLMPNVISAEKTLFWVFWVNGLFVLAMILPTRASYIFESTDRGAILTQAIQKQISVAKDAAFG
tara:strand:+ start:1479 stop:1733 length:255 start_codon:yes stop_codon:yes gene_type:complete